MTIASLESDISIAEMAAKVEDLERQLVVRKGGQSATTN